jgi:iron complex outermembrane receptor protein
MPRNLSAAVILLVLSISSSNAQTQAAATGVEQTKGKADTLVLPTFTVSTDVDKGYIGSNSLSASRAAIPVIDMPLSVTVLTRELIDDTAPLSIMDLARNVSGVSLAQQPGNETFSGLIRGFNPTVSTDGWVSGTEGTADMADTERLEILKGPSAILFTQGGSAGGTMNRVTKIPLTTQKGHISYTAGLYDANRTELDVTGPVPGTNKKLLYRFITAYQDDDGFAENVNVWRRLLTPSLTYRFTDDSEVIAKYTHYDDKRTAYTGVPIDVSNPSVLRFYDVPRERTTNDPEDYAGTNRDRVDMTVNIKLNDNVRTTVGGQFQNSLLIRQFTRPNGNPIVQSDGTVPRYFQRNRSGSRDYRAYNDYVSVFRSGPVRHNLVVGWEATRSEGWINPNNGTFNIEPANLYRRTVRVALPTNGSLPSRPSGTSSNAKAYVMESAKLWKDYVIVSGGITRNWFDSESFLPATGTYQRTLHGSNDTKQYGVIVRPIPSVSLYYSYNENFNPQTGTLGIEHPDGTVTQGPAAPPQETVAKEFGAKFRFMEGRISWNVAKFDINLTNRTETILGTPWGRLIGGGTSKGWETDVFVQITNDWNVIASYSDMDVRDFNGVPVQYATTTTASLWTRYNFKNTVLKGLGVAIGGHHTGDRPINFGANRYKVSGRTLADAAVYYNWKDFRMQLNVENVFDKNYVAGAWLPQRIYFGDGRNVRATVSYSF